MNEMFETPIHSVSYLYMFVIIITIIPLLRTVPSNQYISLARAMMYTQSKSSDDLLPKHPSHMYLVTNE